MRTRPAREPWSPARGRVPRAAVAALLGGLALGACTGGTGGSDGSGPTPPPAEVTLGLIQLIPEEGTDQALLRVTNEARATLEVTAVGLDWPGYGDAFTVPNDATVAAGQTLDLRTTLPSPQCAGAPRPPSEPARGVLETAAGQVAAPLKETSQTYLQRLWRTQCDAALVRSALTFAVVGAWSQEGVGRGASAAATVEVRRPDGTDTEQPAQPARPERLELRRATGSVLYDVTLDRPVVVPAGRSAARGTLRILPGNRCDEHARGQATAPFDFELEVVVGERRALVPLPVDDATANAAQRMLDRVCGKVTTAATG